MFCFSLLKITFWSFDLKIYVLTLSLNHQNNTIMGSPVKITPKKVLHIMFVDIIFRNLTLNLTF